MLPVKTIITRSRSAIHDTDAITYDDEEIINVINCGIRFIRRTIAELQPEILINTISGKLQPGEYSVELPNRPTSIVRVKAGDKAARVDTSRNPPMMYGNTAKIYKNPTPIYTPTITTITYREIDMKPSNFRHTGHYDMRGGTPVMYYRLGMKTICFYPVPVNLTAYTISTIDDIEEVTISDDSPLLTEFDDFLVEYVTIRLQMGNEYELSQESQVMANIYGQIRQLLAPPPPGINTRSYWSSYRGYW